MERMAKRKEWPKVMNFRQIRGTNLYRSANLNTGSESDIQDLKSLGIAAVFDLRADQELMRDRNPPLQNHYMKVSAEEHRSFHTLDESMKKELLHQDEVESGQHKFGIQYHCNFVDMAFMRWCLWESPWYLKPLFAVRYLIDVIFHGYVNYSVPIILYRMNSGTLQSYMADYLDQSALGMNDVLRLLSAPANCPAVLMCATGKDRTGIISALIQAVCQVDREIIIADFAQSDVELAPMRQRTIDHLASFGVKPELAYAPPEAMGGFLDHIDKRYGSISEYLESIGFCSMMQEKLRQNVQAEPTD